ncbi:hypothetical protein QW131_17215 [Roseibium salinum]|nr:hypothetical protein [Roseibium salinum]
MGPFLFVISARDKERLAEIVTNLLDFLERDRARDLDPADLAHTLQVGRAALRERLAIVAGSVEELAGILKTYLSEGTASGLWTTAEATRSEGTLSRSAGLTEIARHWVDGGSVDWLSFATRPHRRLRLPTYPFARDIHNSRRISAVGERPANVSGEADLSVRLDAGDFYLQDHRINGWSILPGAMSIEFARKAVEVKNRVARTAAGILEHILAPAGGT